MRLCLMRAHAHAVGIVLAHGPHMIGTLDEVLARGLLLPLDYLQRWMRAARRAAVRSYREGKRFRSHAAAWTADQKVAWLLEQLHAVVRRAYRHTMHYRELFAAVGFDPEADFGFEGLRP